MSPDNINRRDVKDEEGASHLKKLNSSARNDSIQVFAV